MPVDHIWMFPNKPSRLWNISSKIVLSLVGSTSKLWTDCLNSFNIVNKDVLYDAIENRPVNQGLVTVSNHYSCIDEPVLWGRVNLSKEFMRLKWGVGRLIADCNNNSLVLPIWLVGMDSILPNKKPYIPKIGKTVTVLIGEPIQFKSDVQQLQNAGKNAREIRKYITDRIQDEFRHMKIKAERIHHESLYRS
ncbi:tafazzin isoform X2 [Octopus bimaculoides]|uniref:tafazzin isoform X2 n=1 Tax=Octopus bimaculoides TaxID=37653 RepID=UPI0022E5C22D|nr:tafazzin isoform X2 [Octopus bimaculoides]